MSAHLRNTIIGTAHLPSIGSLLGSEVAHHTPKPPSPLFILTDTTSVPDDNNFVESPIGEFASPKDHFCDGFKCRQSCSMDEAILSADVVSDMAFHLYLAINTKWSCLSGLSVVFTGFPENLGRRERSLPVANSYRAFEYVPIMPAPSKLDFFLLGKDPNCTLSEVMTYITYANCSMNTA